MTAADLSGFSLVELLVALLVLLVGVLGLSAAATVVASNLRIAHLETRASSLARAEIERRLAAGVDSGEPSTRIVGGLQVSVEYGNSEPLLLTLVVSGSAGSDSLADTLVTLAR